MKWLLQVKDAKGKSESWVITAKSVLKKEIARAISEKALEIRVNAINE